MITHHSPPLPSGCFRQRMRKHEVPVERFEEIFLSCGTLQVGRYLIIMAGCFQQCVTVDRAIATSSFKIGFDLSPLCGEGCFPCGQSGFLRLLLGLLFKGIAYVLTLRQISSCGTGSKELCKL